MTPLHRSISFVFALAVMSAGIIILGCAIRRLLGPDWFLAYQGALLIYMGRNGALNFGHRE